MIKDHEVMTLADAYRGSRLTQALIQLIPYFGPYVDLKIQDIISNYNAKRYRIFFDEISRGAIPLNPELIENDDFLFCYFKTISAVQKSRRTEKIIYLARLLKDAFGESKIRNADEYEEVIGIIEDLSFNELRILSTLARFERTFPVREGSDRLQTADKFWPSFTQSVSNDLAIQTDMVQPMLVRLQRSGCYQEFTGGIWDYNGERGHLTPLYYRIEEIVGTFISTD